MNPTSTPEIPLDAVVLWIAMVVVGVVFAALWVREQSMPSAEDDPADREW